MSEFVKVARTSDVPDGGATCVEVGGHRIALFNLGGEFYATDDTCTHAEASLSEGEVVGDEVMCPLHFATFRIQTGEVLSPPADDDLQTYEVRVDGEDVLIRI